MMYRTRLQLAFAGFAVFSVGTLALGVRMEMTRRLTDAFHRQVALRVEVLREDLTSESGAMAGRLAALSARFDSDPF